MEYVYIILIMIISYFLSSYVHEMGHIIGGKIFKWDFIYLVVGPIKIENVQGKVNISIEKNPSLWGGVGLVLPKDGDYDKLDAKWKRVLIAGPLASILVGSICVIICILVVNYFYSFILFLMIGAMQIGMGIVCLLPLKNPCGYTDGERYRRINRNNNEKKEEISLLKISLIDYYNKDFSNIEYKDIEVLVNSKHSSISYYGYYYSYIYYSNMKNDDKKQFYINKMKELENKVPQMIVKECNIKDSF